MICIYMCVQVHARGICTDEMRARAAAVGQLALFMSRDCLLKRPGNLLRRFASAAVFPSTVRVFHPLRPSVFKCTIRMCILLTYNTCAYYLTPLRLPCIIHYRRSAAIL